MSAGAFPSGPPGYLRFLPHFLFTAREGWAGYIAKAWLLALIPSLVIGSIIVRLTAEGAAPDFPPTPPLFLFLVVGAAPILETLLMIPPLSGLRRLAGPGPAALGSAVLWAALHSIAEPVWGLVVWWPFLILSVAYLTWSESGVFRAVLIVTAIHALQNAVAAGLSLLL